MAITIVNINELKGLSDSGLANLLLYGSTLQSLNLSYCSRVTDIGLSYVASGFPFLSAVNLKKCSSITNHGLQILAESCRSLKLVHLTGCSRVTDRGIRSLYQNYRQLTTLSFQGVSHTLASLEDKLCSFDSTGVSDFVSGGALKYFSFSSYIREIGLGFGAKLKILDLKMCGDLVDDATIMKIAKGCPLLQEWNLSYCYKIAISGWNTIGLYCQNLKTLHVHRCVKLGDKGLLAVGYGSNQTSYLVMTKPNKMHRPNNESDSLLSNAQFAPHVFSCNGDKYQVINHTPEDYTQGVENAKGCWWDFEVVNLDVHERTLQYELITHLTVDSNEYDAGQLPILEIASLMMDFNSSTWITVQIFKQPYTYTSDPTCLLSKLTIAAYSHFLLQTNHLHRSC
ncbi:F-box/LRR-repeat protein 12 [Artemisia annua]|uniref:F-box/LRR-repeat protein 12 n=1 Tax=Artemisia annua TaxID=35608 RepID=A0A2U1ME48_ARTAN|nr:F-box/LRR-repeat protein 12 [Artemisia annua]